MHHVQYVSTSVHIEDHHNTVSVIVTLQIEVEKTLIAIAGVTIHALYRAFLMKYNFNSLPILTFQIVTLEQARLSMSQSI